MNKAPKADRIDRAGIFLSGLCLVHCTALPLALAGLQAYGASSVTRALDHDGFHVVMAIVLLGVGLLAFGNGFRRHHRALPLVLGGLGTAFLFWGAFNPGAHLSGAGEHGITVVATLILLFAHAKNRGFAASHDCHTAHGAAEASA